MNKIAVIGCGLIGRSWAVIFARAGLSVTLYDSDQNSLHKALTLIAETMTELHDFHLLNDDPVKLCNNISCASSLNSALKDADYIQENTLEDLEQKKIIFRKLDENSPESTVIASSTSTIATSQFCENLKGRHRCLVAHPVNPPHLIPLVEISPAPFTDTNVIKRVMNFQKQLGQKPILVKREIDGFILNRLQAAVLLESWWLVKEGYISTEDLDKTMKDGLGLRWSFMGPFETIDLNAKGGIEEYAVTFGNLYNQMMKNSLYTGWDENLISKVARERRTTLPKELLDDRCRWRDRRLMSLIDHKKREN